MRCQALHSCKREVQYEVTLNIVAGARDVCRLHATAYEDAGQLRVAHRLTPSFLNAREAATYQRALRARHTENGQCIECSAPAVPPTRRCVKHGQRHREDTRARCANGV